LIEVGLVSWLAEATFAVMAVLNGDVFFASPLTLGLWVPSPMPDRATLHRMAMW
jgi:hypothetical protein